MKSMMLLTTITGLVFIGCVASKDDIKNLENKIDQSNKETSDSRLKTKDTNALPEALCLFHSPDEVNKKVYYVPEGGCKDPSFLNKNKESGLEWCEYRNVQDSAKSSCTIGLSNSFNLNEEDKTVLVNAVKIIIYNPPSITDWVKNSFESNLIQVGCYLPCGMLK